MKANTDATLLGGWTNANDAGNILDLGTGCGIIALMLAQRTSAYIHAIDIDASSINEAKKNFRNCRWHQRLKASHISLQNFAHSEKARFDLIVSNPPFFSNSLKNPDPRKSLARHDENMNIRELLQLSKILMTQTGQLSLILPASEEKNLFQFTSGLPLHLKRICYIYPTPEKSANRIMAEISKCKNSIEYTDITIRHPSGEHTQQYNSLLKPYLLYL